MIQVYNEKKQLLFGRNGMGKQGNCIGRLLIFGIAVSAAGIMIY